jgi:plasmid replication initiation protein
MQNEIQVPRRLNKAIHNFSSALTKRIFWAAMAQIKKDFNVQKDMFEDLWLSVPTNILNCQRYTQLLKTSQELQSGRIEINNPEEEEFDHYIPFPSVKYKKRSGFIQVKVNSDAYPFLAELSQGYFWMQLKSMMLLSSGYAQVWYGKLAEKKDLGKLEGVTIEKIREWMKVDELKYKSKDVKNQSKSMLLKRLLYDPIKEINERTELYITYEPMYGQKRPIIGFDFTIRGQKAKNEAAAYEKIEKYFEEFQELPPRGKAERIQDLQRKYGFPEKIFNELFENTSLLDAVLEADAAIKAGRIEIKTTKDQYMGGVIKRAKSRKGF